MSYFLKMETEEQVLQKLKDDTKKVENTIDNLNGRLLNPWAMQDMMMEWPAAPRQLLREIEDAKQQIHDIQKNLLLFEEHNAKEKKFLEQLYCFVNSVDAAEPDELGKFGMEPILHTSADEEMANDLGSLESVEEKNTEEIIELIKHNYGEEAKFVEQLYSFVNSDEAADCKDFEDQLVKFGLKRTAPETIAEEKDSELSPESEDKEHGQSE